MLYVLGSFKVKLKYIVFMGSPAADGSETRVPRLPVTSLASFVIYVSEYWLHDVKTVSARLHSKWPIAMQRTVV